MSPAAVTMDPNQQSGRGAQHWRPPLAGSRSKGNLDVHSENVNSFESSPLDDPSSGILTSRAAPRHRSASPSPAFQQSFPSPGPSPSSHAYGQVMPHQQTSSTLASAMSFRAAPGSSTGLAVGGASSSMHSPRTSSPSFAARYAASGSDHSRHSSGHGSSLTGASLGTSGGGFAGFELNATGQGTGSLASAASSAGEGPLLGKGSGQINSARGSFSGSPRIGGGLGVPSDFAPTGRIDGRGGSFSGSATGASSFGGSMTNLSAAFARASIGNHSQSLLVSPGSRTSSTAGSAPSAGMRTEHDDPLRVGNLSRGLQVDDAESDFYAKALPASQKDSQSNTSSPFLGAAAPSSTSVPVSLPTTGPLSAADPRTQLYISNLPYRVRWQDVKDLFRRAGTVLRADVSLTPDNRSRGFGTVLMATEDDARKACDMFKGFNWQGRTLDVKIDRSGTILGVGVGQVPSSLLGVPAPNLPGTPGSGARTSPVPSPLGGTYTSVSPGAPQLTSGPVPSPLGQGSLGSQGTGQGAQPLSAHQSPVPLHLQGGPSGAARSFASPQPPNGEAGVRSRIPGGVGMQAHLNAASQFQHSNVPSPFNFAQPALHAANAFGARDIASPYAGHQAGPNMAPFIAQGQQQVLPNALHNANLFGVGQQPFRAMPGNSMAQAVNGLYPTVQPPASGNVPLNAVMTMPPMAHSYYGRVLFVGNLPFHCQWQDLKDLFRAAGNIQRADVALSADGKSRGFGTVLFATPEDARNAVRIYHGYEYSGRTLKVHFDRFAQMTVPQPGTLPASPSQYTSAFAAANTPSHVSSTGGAAGPGGASFGAQAAPGIAQSQMPSQAWPTTLAQHHRSSELPFPAPGAGLPKRPIDSFEVSSGLSEGRRRSSATSQSNDKGLQPVGDASVLDDADGKANTEANEKSEAELTKTPQLRHGVRAKANEARTTASNFSAPGSNAHPGRIALPPQGFAPPMGGMAPFSPIQTRMNVPMTPGMPGFAFHGIPQTPPIQQHMFSPGLGGLLSPGIGSPTYGPATPGIGYGSMINPAPGAPVHYNNGTTTPMASMMAAATAPGFNPMFPPIGTGYQPSMYQAQGYGPSTLPPTPHWSQPRPPPLPSHQQQPQRHAASHQANEKDASTRESAIAEEQEQPIGSGSASTKQQSSADQGYPFPAVGDTSQPPAPLQRRNSTNTPLMSPSAPNGPASLAVKSPGWEQRRGSSSGVAGGQVPAGFGGLGLHDIHVSAGATSTEELARKIAQMSAEKSMRQQQQQQRTASSGNANDKSAVGSRSLAAPLELPLASKTAAAGSASQHVQLSGSALDDGANDAASASANDNASAE